MNTHRRPIRPRDPGDQYDEVTERMDLGEAGRFAKQRFPMKLATVGELADPAAECTSVVKASGDKLSLHAGSNPARCTLSPTKEELPMPPRQGKPANVELVNPMELPTL